MFIPVVLIAVPLASPAEDVLPADRAKGVIAQKARLNNRYTLKLRVEARIPNAPPGVESAWNSTLHLWRDGNKFRVDHFDAEYTPPRPNEDRRDRRVICENCEREGYGISTVVKPGSPPTLHLVEFHRLGTWNLDMYCTHFDWRYFGLSNDSRCSYPRLKIATDFPAFFGLPGIVTRTESRDGVPCLVASRKAKAVEWSVWLSERDAFNPVSFEIKAEVGGVPETRTTEISWQRTAGGHLYPQRVKHNTMITLGTTKCAMEEVVTVTHADFDSPIDPAVFTLAGLGLNENQVIGFPDRKFEDQPLWRNGKVDYSYTAGKQMAERMAQSQAAGAAQPEAPPPPPAAYPSRGNTPLVVAVGAAVLSVATAVLAVVIRRRRKAAA